MCRRSRETFTRPRGFFAISVHRADRRAARCRTGPASSEKNASERLQPRQAHTSTEREIPAALTGGERCRTPTCSWQGRSTKIVSAGSTGAMRSRAPVAMPAERRRQRGRPCRSRRPGAYSDRSSDRARPVGVACALRSPRRRLTRPSGVGGSGHRAVGYRLLRRREVPPMGYGVIGSPTVSGSVSLGSSPGTPARNA